jgi:hypothetical protein
MACRPYACAVSASIFRLHSVAASTEISGFVQTRMMRGPASIIV